MSMSDIRIRIQINDIDILFVINQANDIELLYI